VFAVRAMHTAVPFTQLSQDEMVPPEQMHELFKLQECKQCRLVEFPEAHHMDAYDADPVNYWAALQEFMVQFL